jgi:hypothetical protein
MPERWVTSSKSAAAGAGAAGFVAATGSDDTAGRSVFPSKDFSHPVPRTSPARRGPQIQPRRHRETRSQHPVHCLTHSPMAAATLPATARLVQRCACGRGRSQAGRKFEVPGRGSRTPSTLFPRDAGRAPSPDGHVLHPRGRRLWCAASVFPKPVSLQVGARTFLSARCPDSITKRTRMSALRKIEDVHTAARAHALTLNPRRQLFSLRSGDCLRP